MTMIHELPPRETSGREMIARVNMQFKAAAFAALKILDNSEVDRVYCDYHDDFVVRKKVSGGVVYDFYQVKTKGKRNHLWTLAEIFALKKRGQKADAESLKAIADSFAGRLLVHTVNFGDVCGKVTLLTNIQFHDDVESLVKELQNCIITSSSGKIIADNLVNIFKLDSTLDKNVVLAWLKKLELEPGVQYIGSEPDDFVAAARAAIFKYSEIDLTHQEINEIAESLVSLVHRKSFAKVLTESTPYELDDIVGVGIDDMLSILSISRDVYQALLLGEDGSVIKSASIIQRKMKAAGASDSMIEYCSQQKVKWDLWLRNERHLIPEFDLNFILDRIQQVQTEWMSSGGSMSDLQGRIQALRSESLFSEKTPSLTQELVLGGILASMVRRKAQ